MPLQTASTACRRALSFAPGRAGFQSGQSTVEFALVTATFLVVIVGLGALWRLASGGALVEHALATASHCIERASPQAMADVLLY